MPNKFTFQLPISTPEYGKLVFGGNLEISGVYSNTQEYIVETVTLLDTDNKRHTIPTVVALYLTDWDWPEKVHSAIVSHLEYLELGIDEPEHTDHNQDDLLKTFGDIFKPHAA